MASSSRGVRMNHTSTFDYLDGRETLRRQELVWGTVREPAAPRFQHQAVVTRLTVLLDREARIDNRGTVVVSPIDVVLDIAQALVLQPDILYVSTARRCIVGEWVSGAPDLVVEVLSPGTARTDRSEKLEWYGTYGVREYWLVDPHSMSIECITFGERGHQRRRWTGQDPIESAVLGQLTFSTEDVFEHWPD
jgi:Uma2 family endonuclease